MKLKNSVKKIIGAAVLFVFAIAVGTVSVFAWFIGGNTTVNNIEFNTGKIEVMVELFAMRDFNFDGIVDKDSNGQEVLENIKATGIMVKNATPGQIFSFRMRAENLSAAPIYFAMTATNPAILSGQVGLNSALTFNTTVADTFGSVASYKVPLLGQKIVLIDESNATDTTLSGKIPLIQIPSSVGGSAFIFDFTLKFEHLAYLQSNSETAPTFAGLTDLNAYFGKKLFDTATKEGARFYFEFRQSKIA